MVISIEEIEAAWFESNVSRKEIEEIKLLQARIQVLRDESRDLQDEAEHLQSEASDMLGEAKRKIEAAAEATAAATALMKDVDARVVVARASIQIMDAIINGQRRGEE